MTDRVPKSSSAAELFTPEVLRKTASSGGLPPTRPGEKTPSKSRSSSDPRSPSVSATRTRLRQWGTNLSFVPWWALVSLALLVGGLTVFAIKGKKAADSASDLLTILGSNTDTGYPKYMDAYSTSVWATVGVTAAAIVAVMFAAGVRLDQRLRRAGRYSVPKGSYGPGMFKFFTFLSWLALLVLAGLAAWAALNGTLLASWSAQCWNLEKGTNVASNNIAQLYVMKGQYVRALESFKDSVMSSVSNTTAAAKSLTAKVAPTIENLKFFSGNYTELSKELSEFANDIAAGKADTGGAAEKLSAAITSDIAMLQKLATGNTQMKEALDDFASALQASAGTAMADQIKAALAASMGTLKEFATNYTLLSQDMNEFGKALMSSTNSKMQPVSTTIAKLNATVNPGIVTLRQFANNYTEIEDGTGFLQQDQEGVCPSVACLNMAFYPFTESTTCLCSKAALESVHDLAHDSSDTALWGLIAAAAIFAGAVIGCMEVAADSALLGADQVFMRVIRRKSSRASSRGSGRELREREPRDNHMSPAPSVQSKGSRMSPAPSSQYLVHAQAQA